MLQLGYVTALVCYSFGILFVQVAVSLSAKHPNPAWSKGLGGRFGEYPIYFTLGDGGVISTTERERWETEESGKREGEGSEMRRRWRVWFQSDHLHIPDYL